MRLLSVPLRRVRSASSQVVPHDARPSRVESLEPRRLLSADLTGRSAVLMPAAEATVLPLVNKGADSTPLTAVPEAVRPETALPGVAPAIAAAFARATDLTQYDPSRLATVEQWVFAADVRADADRLADALGARLVTPSGVLPGVFVASFDRKVSPDVVDSFEGADVAAYYPVVPLERTTRAVPNDPRFADQWHLLNTGQGGGTSGVDANVTSVWDNYTGDGVTIGVVDDGLHYTHPDLAPNYVAADSYDWVGNDPFPMPSGYSHGTSVAGVAAARGNNGAGVSGAAPEAWLAGLRLLGNTTDANEAAALTYHNQNIDIYSNSWGPYDTGIDLEGPGALTLAALEQTATTGRGGLGGIITWAGGNGGEDTDNSNRDGYANNRHTISVAAITNAGMRSSYSEPGANHLVSAYSSGGSLGITTTSGSSSYTNSFGGTSSATPLVSGVIALMLEANPALTARDVQHILVNSAEKNDPFSASWDVNGAGHEVSHLYGFGAIDAQAAVAMAQTWQNVGSEVSWTSGTRNVFATIPDANATGLSRTLSVPDDVKIEHVEVVLDVAHSYRGDLEVFLTSPDGTESQLLASNLGDDNNNITNWSFSSTHHWDEQSGGNWTLRVADRASLDVGQWRTWSLNLYGTAIDESQPPEVMDFDFEFQDRQALVMRFDQDVASSLQGSDLTVRNVDTDATVAAQLLGYDTGSNTATFGFNSLLADGNYVATLDGTVTNSSGQDVNPPGSLDFWFLGADANRDRRVNLFDYAALLNGVGTSNPTFSEGDFNYDNRVNLFDYAILLNQAGKRLAAPASLGGGGGSLFADGSDSDDGDRVAGAVLRT